MCFVSRQVWQVGGGGLASWPLNHAACSRGCDQASTLKSLATPTREGPYSCLARLDLLQGARARQATPAIHLLPALDPGLQHPLTPPPPPTPPHGAASMPALTLRGRQRRLDLVVLRLVPLPAA